MENYNLQFLGGMQKAKIIFRQQYRESKRGELHFIRETRPFIEFFAQGHVNPHREENIYGSTFSD